MKDRSRIMRGGYPPLPPTLSNLLETTTKEIRRYAKDGTLDVPAIRRKVIKKLDAAIQETYALGKKGAAASEKFTGDPDKIKYYRLMGYLISILNGLLENVSLDELNRRLAKVEEYYAALKGQLNP